MTEIAGIQATTPAADRARPTRPSEPKEPVPARPEDGPAGVESELLIEDVSIDGMCGVY